MTEPVTITKLRLIMRESIADNEGRLVSYDYKTIVVEIPDEQLKNDSGYVVLPEVIGGEWVQE